MDHQELNELRKQIHLIYEDMPTEQPDMPEHLMTERAHGTYIRPSDEEWEECYQRWMYQLGQAKHWIDVTYRRVAVEKQPISENDRLVIGNCQDLVKDYAEAKHNGFMQIGWLEQYEEK